ncbi:MAG: NADH-quinone oxidoreductase subunit NuoE [Rhodobacteraceae bacterium HLUCCA08]|nr:MAG: NADH-quinone oxidoreductase subunit NuoE [Rhodobacteraceae bacterium HLUCCA08]
MLRRLHHEQPDDFAFTPANQAWAEAQITKYPDGRQASAIIPLLWRAQEQEGWLSRPAIEHVADMLGLAHIRALEVASFYFMFQLQPVGSVAHIQICGTTSCMICGAEDLIGVCRDKIAPNPHQLSADGRFSWEEVECLGACANAPMAQIGKDYYEDLTAESLADILDRLAAGEVPLPGPQNGRFASEPLSGLTSLDGGDGVRHQQNASVQLAADLGDSVKRIDGTEVPLTTPWLADAANKTTRPPVTKARPSTSRRTGDASDKVSEVEGEARGVTAKARPKDSAARGDTAGTAKAPAATSKAPDTPAKSDTAPASAPGSAPVAEERAPERLDAPQGAADDLKRISGVGPKLEALLNEMGFWHFHQIAAWGAQEIAWVDARLKFKGRIERDDWVAQARKLAEG